MLCCADLGVAAHVSVRKKTIIISIIMIMITIVISIESLLLISRSSISNQIIVCVCALRVLMRQRFSAFPFYAVLHSLLRSFSLHKRTKYRERERELVHVTVAKRRINQPL